MTDNGKPPPAAPPPPEKKAKSQSKPSQPFRFLTLDELAREKPRPWLVPDVVARGDLVLAWGDPKSGKTLAVTALAVRTILGQPWFTARAPAPDQPVRVAYIAAEGAARDRFDQAIAAFGLLRDDSPRTRDRLAESIRVIPDPVKLGDAEGLMLLVDSARQSFGGNSPDLWIVDTLSRCAAGLDENSAAEMSKVVDAITRSLLAPNEHGQRAAVLLIHHGTKDGKHERGSSVFRGAWDREIKFKREGLRVAISCDSTRTTGFSPFTARIETVPTVDFGREDCGPFVDYDGTPLTTARLVQVESVAPGASGLQAAGLSRPPDRDIDRVGRVVRELVEKHHAGRAPSKAQLEQTFRDTSEDHGLPRKDYRRVWAYLLERRWILEEPEGSGKRTAVLPGPGPDAIPSPVENGRFLFADPEVMESPDPVH